MSAMVKRSNVDAVSMRLWTYQGRQIRARADEKVSLTDMWKASGADPNKRPADWLRTEQTIGFIEFLADFQGVGDGHSLVFAEKGTPQQPGTTWAHWHLALSYARYLDHAFHLWCNEIIRRELSRSGDRPAALDGTVANSARVSDDPIATDRLRLQTNRVCLARGYSKQRVYGFVRRTQRVSSPFALSLHLLPHVLDSLEHIERGLVSLTGVPSLPAPATNQLALWRTH